MSALTDGNQNYVRYDSQDPPQPVVPQPTTTPGSTDPGAGWETKPYLNFNGNYRRYDEDNNLVTPQPLPNGGNYQKRDRDNNIIPQQPYQRHDENNQPVT